MGQFFNHYNDSYTGLHLDNQDIWVKKDIYRCDASLGVLFQSYSIGSICYPIGSFLDHFFIDWTNSYDPFPSRHGAVDGNGIETQRNTADSLTTNHVSSAVGQTFLKEGYTVTGASAATVALAISLL